MRADRIVLSDFRNIEEAELPFSETVNVICGDNAQGKTNLIEALFLFSSGRTFRPAKEKNLIRFGQERASVRLSFSSRGRDMETEIKLYQDKKKEIFINGVKAEKQSELSGLFCSVLFLPEHLELVKGGPSPRRRFLDFAICQLRPKYGAALTDYQKILMQKNNLLKDIYKNPQLRDTLDVWNSHLANAGAYISFMRQSYVKKLQGRAAQYQDDISGGKEKMEVFYQGFAEALPETLPEIRDAFLLALREKEDEEIALGSGFVGPHRDDIKILLNQKDARLFASQGQQRSCVLSLKLAEGDAVLEGTGESPVYLFDDILSELDESRQNYIVQRIKEKQVFLTCCEKERFSSFPDGRSFSMENGVVRQAGD